MLYEILGLIGIATTLVFTVLHFFLDMKKHKDLRKLTEQKLEIERSKTEIEQGKIGLDMVMQLFPQFKEMASLIIEDPKKFYEQIEKLKQVAEEHKKIRDSKK